MGAKLITEENAEKVKQKVVSNILTKVREGKTPTAMEMELLDKYTASSDVGFSGTYAKNQTELAKLIGVDRKTIQRWRKDPTFPKPKADGRYTLSEVVAWKDSMGSTAGDLTSKESAQVKSILLQNEKLEIQVGILKSEYTPNVDIDQEVAEMVQQAKRELLALPSSLAPQVIGQTVAEAEKIIKQSLVEALRSLHEGEWSSGEK
jgi:predicted DNA-binding transcriptional regulator AlpA